MAVHGDICVNMDISKCIDAHIRHGVVVDLRGIARLANDSGVADIELVTEPPISKSRLQLTPNNGWVLDYGTVRNESSNKSPSDCKNQVTNFFRHRGTIGA